MNAFKDQRTAMRRYSGVMFWLAGLLLCVPGALHASTFTPLGNLDGVGWSSALGVSSDGSVVTGSTSVGGDPEAFVWDAIGGMRGIGDLPGGLMSSRGTAISADGSTVVGYSIPENGIEAFVWSETNGMQGLDDLWPGGGVPNSFAYGVSADGSVVVGQAIGPGGVEPFRWDATNGMQGLGFLSNSTSEEGPLSEAKGVSADGSIVVGIDKSDFYEPPEAFIWDATNGIQELIDPAAGITYSSAYGISADGAVVVGQANFGGGNQAFVWDATNGIQGIGDFPGGNFFSRALAVSSDGSVVVGWGTPDFGEKEAFIWDANSGMQSLKAVLSSRGLATALAGWQLTQATGISADGLTIVGWGTNPGGVEEAFVANLDGQAISVPSLGPLGVVMLASLLGLAVRRGV